MKKDFSAIMTTCEDLVRSGETGRARSLLGSLNPADVPRAKLKSFANLCRRTDLIQMGLKLMSRLIHLREGEWQTSATPSELAEYGALLQKTGALREALWILKKSESAETPEALLYQAYCHMNLWEYEQAMALLKQHQYSEQRKYQRFVGMVNMAASLVTLGHTTEALNTINSNIEMAQAEGFTRLLANCFELRAQVFVQKQALAMARADLHAAASILKQTETSDYFYIEKWLAIINGLEAKDASPILALRTQAIERRQWESVRDADRYILQISPDHTRLYHLLFGTPFLGFRQKVIREHGISHIPEQLLIGHTDHPTLDIRSGQLSGRFSNCAPPSKTVHRLLSVFTRDLYRPIALGGVFTELFPDEYFDSRSSFHRVHQAIYRLRHWIQSEDLPIQIVESDGCYSLKVTGELSLQIPFERTNIDSQEIRVEKLRQMFWGKRFSSQQAGKALNLSLSSCKELLKWSLNMGLIVKEGAGPSTRYLFVEPGKSASRAAA